MSRRKYSFMCKIQKSMFDPSNNSWSSNNITYGDIKMNLRTGTIANHAVENFVLDDKAFSLLQATAIFVNFHFYTL